MEFPDELLLLSGLVSGRYVVTGDFHIRDYGIGIELALLRKCSGS
jgi:hypothetical protein